MIDRNSKSQKFVTENPRKVGLVCFGMGLGVIYWMLILPIQESQAGVAEIVISIKLVVVGVMLVFMGLGFIIFGPRSFSVLRPSPGQSKAPLNIALSVFSIIGLIAYFCIQHYLKSKGYSFR